MALARLNMPGPDSLRRVDCARAVPGPRGDDSGRVRGRRRARGRPDDRPGLQDARGHACPGAGACGGQFTANTMAIVCEALGIAALGSGSVPATDRGQGGGRARGRRAGRQAGGSADQPRDRSSRAAPSRTRSPWSRRPADRPTPCCTCWRSPRRRASSSTIADFDRISAATPLIADLKPSGRFVATDLHAAGGSPLVIKRLVEVGRDRPAMSPTVTGRTLGEEAAKAVETPGQEVVRPIDRPLKPNGGLVILFGNLAPEGGGAQALRDRTRAASRAGARVRQRRGRRSTPFSSRPSRPATSS